MHMQLQFKKPYLLFVSTTSHTSLLKEVCVIGDQQMDLLKSSRIKCLEHLKTLQVGIWVNILSLQFQNAKMQGPPFSSLVLLPHFENLQDLVPECD